VRPYHQFCGVARALDVVGERWSLLIVRELLVRDGRFTDLKAALPGIATNMLTERLRALEDAQVIERFKPAQPASGTAYRLTPRGRALQPVLRELARWSIPMMAAGKGDDVSRAHWLVLALEALFQDAGARSTDEIRVGVESEGERISLRLTSSGDAVVGIGDLPDADLRISGSPESVIGAVTGLPTAAGATIEGDPDRLEALRARSVVHGDPPVA